MREPLRILSLGGGTQSCALALMSAAGELPRLDHVVFADTQGELPETYEYLDYLRGHLDAAGIPFHVVTAGNLLMDLLVDTPTANNPTPPVHVLNPDGSKGRIGQYRCSYDYKRRVITRKVKALCGGRGAWKRACVEQWIGFSLEEVGRMRQADDCRCGHRAKAHDQATRSCARCGCHRFDRWEVNRWPLIELGMRRHETVAWFTANGHPTPPRSACYFCPNSRNDRWQTLSADHPPLFENACHLDDTIRNGGGFNARGGKPFAGKMFLHESLVPLRDADLRTTTQVRADAGEHPLFDPAVLAGDCEAGVCFT